MTTTQDIATKNSNGGRSVATVLVSIAGLFGVLVAIAGLALVGVQAFAPTVAATTPPTPSA
jgi:hypothetical protein